MWIHLSSQILSNQLSCGKAEPGRHNKTVTMITQLNAGKSLNSFFFKLVPVIYKTSRRYKFDLLKFRFAHGL